MSDCCVEKLEMRDGETMLLSLEQLKVFSVKVAVSVSLSVTYGSGFGCGLWCWLWLGIMFFMS
jgi:hypothetical protein